EVANEAAELRAAASGIEVAAFSKNGELGDARHPSVREDLDDSGDGVGAVDGGFGAAHHFNLVHVVEGKVGEVHSVAWFVDGRAVDQDFGEIGVATVEKYGSRAAFRAGAADGDAGRGKQHIGKRDGKPRRDAFGGDYIHRSRGLLDGQRL